MTTITHQGEDFEIDAKLFAGYKDEAFLHLKDEATAKARFKEVIETVSETTKLPKALVSKYFKARFKEETKKAKQLGDTFEALDEALDGPAEGGE